jgi:hypothetical protein
MAIRYFAGGCPCDIALVHGVSKSEVYASAWRVVDAVNQTPGLKIEFPMSHTEQRKIAYGFFRKSDASGFEQCVGAIDGVLIWTEKPTLYDCLRAVCGPKKFLCAR